MNTDLRRRFVPTNHSYSQLIKSSISDTKKNRMNDQATLSNESNEPDDYLASDIYCRSLMSKPIRSWRATNPYRTGNEYHTFYLPKPITPVGLPRLTYPSYQSKYLSNNRHRDFGSLNALNRSLPVPTSTYHFNHSLSDYEKYHIKKGYSIKPLTVKQRWKVCGYVLIFYFMLKKNLHYAKQKDTYYQRDVRRIRFLELLTAIHRIYLEPDSAIHRALSQAISPNTSLLNQYDLFYYVQTIINHITKFLPEHGILGSSSDESVLVYLIRCSLDQFPSTFFWSVERQHLQVNYSKMRRYGEPHLDHYTTKFLIISTFIYYGLIKTLLIKPVKFRLARGQLSRTQWLNSRLLSSLILYVGRHAVIYREDKSHSCMPFPAEMKNYLIEDERLEKNLWNLEQLVESTAPKLSAWACDYAEQLHRHMKTMIT